MEAHGGMMDATWSPKRLEEPLSWASPRRIGLPRGQDLFDGTLPFDAIAAAFGAMAATPHHRFQLTTRHPERMAQFFDWITYESDRVPGGRGPASLCILKLLLAADLPDHLKGGLQHVLSWPLPHVEMSIEEPPPSALSGANANAQLSLL